MTIYGLVEEAKAELERRIEEEEAWFRGYYHQELIQEIADQAVPIYT